MTMNIIDFDLGVLVSFAQDLNMFSINSMYLFLTLLLVLPIIMACAAENLRRSFDYNNLKSTKDNEIQDLENELGYFDCYYGHVVGLLEDARAHAGRLEYLKAELVQDKCAMIQDQDRLRRLYAKAIEANELLVAKNTRLQATVDSQAQTIKSFRPAKTPVNFMPINVMGNYSPRPLMLPDVNEELENCDW